MLQELFKYYLANQEDLVKKYNGKYIVIKNNEVVGAYNTDSEAYFNSISKYKPGSFMIQKCTPGEEAYTQRFSSRVIFG
jgi:hypothetical protein